MYYQQRCLSSFFFVSKNAANISAFPYSGVVDHLSLDPVITIVLLLCNIESAVEAGQRLQPFLTFMVSGILLQLVGKH